MEIPRYWRTQKDRYQDLGGGVIFSFTEYISNDQCKNIAIILLENGKKITAQLTDYDQTPQIGDLVECVTRKLKDDENSGFIVYGYKFRPSFSSK